MIIRLVAVGNKLDSWLNSGYQEYAKRMPKSCKLELVEIPAVKRVKTMSTSQCQLLEAKRIAAVLPDNAQVFALDEHGQQWDTNQLSAELASWLQNDVQPYLLIGGADGLDPSLLKRATKLWSLSKLTLPHGLVRVMVAEQVYRAYSLLMQHPYHRP